MCIRFNTIPECDGETEGFAITILRSARTGMLTHSNNNYSSDLRENFTKEVSSDKEVTTKF